MNLQVCHPTAQHPITLWITSNQNSFYWVFITFSKLNHLVQFLNYENASQNEIFWSVSVLCVCTCLCFQKSQANKLTWKPKPDILKRSCWRLIFETDCSLLKRISNLALSCYLTSYKSTLIVMSWCSLKGYMWVWFILLFFFSHKKLSISDWVTLIEIHH